MAQLPQPDLDAVPFHFPAVGAQNIGVIGFYFPGKEERWDTLCGASFLGNFWEQGPGALQLEAPCLPGVVRSFTNAEAAFQALKFWGKAEEFAGLSGSEAFRKKRGLSGQEDFTYGGFGSNWKGMMAVLRTKFAAGTPLAEALVKTGDAYLLEHNARSGRDKVWSDNADGSGTNWLGIQLMLLREELSGRSAYTKFFQGAMNLETGKALDAGAQQLHEAVLSARDALVAKVVAMPRKYCLGGNWKSNPAQLSTVLDLCSAFKSFKFDTNKVEVVVFCTTLHGAAAMKALQGSDVEVGIQNISKTGCGAFTGEVTAEMAVDAGYKWCLIGHSERRTLYGETVDDTIAKLQAAQAAGLKIMFCIGETLSERESGVTDAVNQTQLAMALPKVWDWDRFVIAYEPVWAIGTGKVATPEQAQETQLNIRRYVESKMGAETAARVRIQYGGSASPSNVEGLAAKPDIDGFLVGGASLKPDFTKMMEHLSG